MNFSHLTDELSNYAKTRIVFVGLGNELRADDGAGLELVERLRLKKEFSNSHFIIAGRNPENHLSTILNYNPKAVIFIDAAEMNLDAGEIKVLKEDEILNAEFSTHAFSVKIIKDFLLNHGRMDFLFIGIQPGITDFGGKLSEPVRLKLKEFFNDEI